MRSLKIALILPAALLFISGCEQPTTNQSTTSVNTGTSQPNSPSQSNQAQDIAVEGKMLFATNCMICHKDTGKGGKVTINGRNIEPEDLTTDKMKAMTDERLIGYVTNGLEDEGMPAFKEKLTADEIRSVVSYVRTLQAQ